MRKLVFCLCFCLGLQNNPGFSMMDIESSPPSHKKIIKKGFKPDTSPSTPKATIVYKKHVSSDDGPLLYDSERDMYYYGKTLSEALQQNNGVQPSFKKTTHGGIVTLKNNK